MFLFIFLTLASAVSFAKYTGGSRTPQQTLTDGNWSGQNNVYGSIIPYKEGIGLAASYEKSVSEQLGVGGALTFLPEEDSPGNTAVGLLSLAANVRFHYNVQYFDLYFAPGLNLMMMESGSEDDTTIGASFAVGSLAQISKNFALGLELSVIQPWFNDDFFIESRGYFFNSSITGRITF